ncbi:MAG: hypothetical protein U0694_02655 [Anaerolineae bacterium]
MPLSPNPALFGLIIANFDIGFGHMYSHGGAGFLATIIALLNIGYRGQVLNHSSMSRTR